MTKTPRFQPPTDPMEDALRTFARLLTRIHPLVWVALLSTALTILAISQIGA
jgi:peptidoglycan/LPS O-acetylase OafA/YrhL